MIASRAKPLIVEWPSADRGKLEAQVRNHGLAVVDYSGCTMRILDRCTGGAMYKYSPITRKTDSVVIRDTDDLYANVPVGAAKLEAKLAKSGELDVQMTMVGRWETPNPSFRLDQLQGECAGATHVVSAVTVGAFTFTAGADAEVGGGATVLGVGGGAEEQLQARDVEQRRQGERVRQGHARRSDSSGRMWSAYFASSRPARARQSLRRAVDVLDDFDG